MKFYVWSYKTIKYNTIPRNTISGAYLHLLDVIFNQNYLSCCLSFSFKRAFQWFAVFGDTMWIFCPLCTITHASLPTSYFTCSTKKEKLQLSENSRKIFCQVFPLMGKKKIKDLRRWKEEEFFANLLITLLQNFHKMHRAQPEDVSIGLTHACIHNVGNVLFTSLFGNLHTFWC